MSEIDYPASRDAFCNALLDLSFYRRDADRAADLFAKVVSRAMLELVPEELAAATARAERAEAALQRVREAWRYIADIMATSSRDWSESATDAWLYGAIVGWGDGPDDPDEAWTELAAKYWDADDIAQLKDLHAALAALDGTQPTAEPTEE